MSQKNGSKFGLALLVGAAAGYAASLFVSKKTRDAHKKQLTETSQKLADKFLSEEDQQKAKDLFDTKSKEALEQFQAIKMEVVKNLDASTQTLKEVNKKKYLKAVEKTIEDLTKKKSLNTKQLTKLRGFLEADYVLFKNLKKTTNSKKKASKKS